MRLIEQSFEIIPQEDYSIDGIYKQIERAARVCYKSEDRITDSSAKSMVDKLINAGHTAMLEHGTVYLECEYFIAHKYIHNPHSVVHHKTLRNKLGAFVTYFYITTNYRVLVENNWLGDLKYLCAPTSCHEKRIMVKINSSIAIQRELCRHRVFSFANESTRYCNYSKDKFSNELTFIEPLWYESVDSFTKNEFDAQLRSVESLYKFLIDKELKSQEAREILPLCTKSELIMTGTEHQWKEMFKLRCDEHAHPQMIDIATKIREEFCNCGYIDK